MINWNSVVVSLANFYDTIIDFPNSPAMFKTMINELASAGIITKELGVSCESHLDTIKKELEEDYKA